MSGEFKSGYREHSTQEPGRVCSIRTRYVLPETHVYIYLYMYIYIYCVNACKQAFSMQHVLTISMYNLYNIYICQTVVLMPLMQCFFIRQNLICKCSVEKNPQISCLLCCLHKSL